MSRSCGTSSCSTTSWGRSRRSEKLYRSLSPIYYVDSIQTPLFLINGEGKDLPRSNAGRQFADRLEFRYKAGKFKAYPNENYYIRSAANIRTMLGDMQAYFDQYLKDSMHEPDRRIARD